MLKGLDIYWHCLFESIWHLEVQRGEEEKMGVGLGGKECEPRHACLLEQVTLAPSPHNVGMTGDQLRPHVSVLEFLLHPWSLALASEDVVHSRCSLAHGTHAGKPPSGSPLWTTSQLFLSARALSSVAFQSGGQVTNTELCMSPPFPQESAY